MSDMMKFQTCGEVDARSAIYREGSITIQAAKLRAVLDTPLYAKLAAEANVRLGRKFHSYGSARSSSELDC